MWMANIVIISLVQQSDTLTWRDAVANLKKSTSKLPVQLFSGSDCSRQATCPSPCGNPYCKCPDIESSIDQDSFVIIHLVNDGIMGEWLIELIKQKNPKGVFCFACIPELMQLTRIGNYSMKNSSGGMPGPLKKVLKFFSGGREEDVIYVYSKLSKITARLLPFIPKKYKDVTHWINIVLYWGQPDVYNREQLLRFIAREIFDLDVTYKPVKIIPSIGCFDPFTGELFVSPEEYLSAKRNDNASSTAKPTIALLVFRQYAIERQPFIKDVAESLLAKNLLVIPIFASGVETQVAVRKWLLQKKIDCIVNTMGFSLVGGPAIAGTPGLYKTQSGELLTALNIPYLVVPPLVAQNRDCLECAFEKKKACCGVGVDSFQKILMYDIPEMDGAIVPLISGAMRQNLIQGIPNRIHQIANQVSGWVNLRKKEKQQVKIALVIYNFPPGQGKVGTAALLNIPLSLLSMVKRLREEGYSIDDFPQEEEACKAMISRFEGRNAPKQASVQEYRQLLDSATQARIDAKWGNPPGNIDPVDRQTIRLNIQEFGNLCVGVQPVLGVPGDPMQFCFDKEFTPHHQYVLFYRWIKECWGADVLIHVGMHGTVEWMPGLQLGLSSSCWPDILLGDLPNIYLYPLNNPSEAIIAKRRANSVIVSHMLPPYVRVGDYSRINEMRTALADHDLPLEDVFFDLEKLPDETDADFRKRAGAYIDDIEEHLISIGLHVFGKNYGLEEIKMYCYSILNVNVGEKPGLSELIRRELGCDKGKAWQLSCQLIDATIINQSNVKKAWQKIIGSATACPLDELTPIVEEGLRIAYHCANNNHEADVLVNVLAGGYVAPAPGRDPLRSGSIALPSGRNIYGTDPWRLPDPIALPRGKELSEQLIQRFLQKHDQHYPETIAITLWALDTIKTEGESLATILSLTGAEPLYDGQGKIYRYQPIPLEKLGRPRIDVCVDMSAIFRDSFSHLVNLLDTLFIDLSHLEEPVSENYIRKHYLEALKSGISEEDASSRIFSRPPGRYGNGIDQLIQESAWEDEDELEKALIQTSSFSYGGVKQGKPCPQIFKKMLATVDNTFQLMDSTEYGLTDIPFYFSSSGALRMVAERISEKKIDLIYAETYAGKTKINEAKELVAREVRAKLLNPQWHEALMNNGYAGAAELGNQFTNVLGMAAIEKNIDKWVFDEMAENFILNQEKREWLEKANIKALGNMITRLLEANNRGAWDADEDMLNALESFYDEIEDKIEGINNGNNTESK